MDAPEPLPIPVQVVVSRELEIVSISDRSDLTEVPFGGGTYTALLLPDGEAPVVLYVAPRLPLWLLDELDEAGIHHEAVQAAALAHSLQDVPLALTAMWPFVNILTLPNGILLVFSAS